MTAAIIPFPSAPAARPERQAVAEAMYDEALAMFERGDLVSRENMLAAGFSAAEIGAHYARIVDIAFAATQLRSALNKWRAR